ncbi:diacylglycerol acyltransferase-domain-containing protein [Trichophaea hybrida]|nr:diacylglycerol acyltransferase-domain-containing protein [Trichophaea hybrida]
MSGSIASSDGYIDSPRPATPPNEKIGISYAEVTAAKAPPPIRHSSTGIPESTYSRPHPTPSTSAPTSYSSALEKPSPEERKRHRAERQVQEQYEEQERLLAEQKAERRRKRREKDEQERLEWEKYEQEKQRRRKERKERRERERLESGGESATSSRTFSPPANGSEKIGYIQEEIEGGSKGIERSSLVPAVQMEERPSLVSAVQKIHWAPLNIPLPRRLQTAAVLWHTLSMTLCFGFFWFVLAIPLSWPLLVPYLIYVFFFATNHADGSAPYKRSEFLRSLSLWRLYTEYFPMRLHRTVELDPSKNYIFAYHPHGIISHGAFGNFCTEATGFKELFPGIKNTLLTIDSNFNIPFNREYLLAMGLASVSKSSCEALLRGDGIPKKKARSLWRPITWVFPQTVETPKDEGGRAITIAIGGARESLEARPGAMKLVCKMRRGFLKLAIREGAGVVPVLSFGENDLYEQLMPDKESWIRKMQLAAKKTLGFTIPLIHARGVFNYDVGLMPYRHEINTVVGKPIFPPKNTDPSDQEVSEFQKRYIDELQRMWDEWKDVFAKDRLPGSEGELEIIE